MVDRAIPNPATAIRQGRIKMLLILAICASPVVLGTLAYWFYRSESTTNYGSFIEPQRQAEGLEAYRGKWVLLTSDSPRCDEACAKRLYLIRQIRLTQGKDKERVERVLLLSEPGKAAFVVEGVEGLEKVHEGMHQLYLEPEKRARLMGIATGELAAGTVPDKGIFLVDPLGHVMMRFPEDPDPSRMKKDLSKLLKWSRVG